MTNQRLRFLDVLMSEKELSVEIAQVNGIEVNEMDFHEPAENEILEQFATNSSSTNHQDPSLVHHVSMDLRLHKTRCSPGLRGSTLRVLRN